MREDYFLDISIYDTQRNFEEIKKRIKDLLNEATGVDFHRFIRKTDEELIEDVERKS